MGITDRELRERLIAYGFNPPPVTDSSRDILLKKLHQFEASSNGEMTDSQLKERLLAYGFNPPPITDSSRDILLKKLKQFEASSNGDRHVPTESKPRKAVKPTRRETTPDRYERPRRGAAAANDTSSRRAVVDDVDTAPRLQESDTSTRRTNNNNSYRSPSSNSKKDAFDFDFDSKKVKNSTPLVLVDKYRHNQLDKGSDSDDSYTASVTRPSSTLSYLTRKPLNVRRETEFFSTPSVKKYDYDSSASSFVHQTRQRSFNTSNRGVEWSKRFSQYVSNVSTSSIVLVIFALFFLVVGYIYYSQNDQVAGELVVDTVEKPFCSRRGKEGLSCIMDNEMGKSLNAWRTIFRALHNIQIKTSCKDGKATSSLMKQIEAIEILTNDLDVYRYEAEKLVTNVIVLTKVNPKYKMRWSDVERGFYLENPELPWSCAFKSWFKVFVEYAFLALLSIGLIVSMHVLVRYVLRQREERSRGTQELIKGIVDILQQNAIVNPLQTFMPIVHVRDQLISYADRERKKQMWAEAVKDVEQNESRIRKEVQMYQGEDYDVWRWVGGHQSTSSSPKPKTWQGEAFETSKDNMNTPAVSPTPCLKIRHMFSPNDSSNDGDDWVTGIKDAILERCEGINIVHISVDETSAEGCVYLKCASTEDAGKAYCKIHGAWYDGKIISVKYLRLERYHERFPSSVNYCTPLAPSNDLRRSIA